jgi:hypothetical protein
MKIGIRRFLQLAVAAPLLAGVTHSVRADRFVFDPTGLGGVGAFSVDSFQLGSGNSLARNVVPFTVDSTFQLLFQAQQTFVVPATVFRFEITVVGSVTERVTTANAGPPSRLTFQLAKNQTSDSFIEIYSDSLLNADDLQGTGFNDGVLVLRGSLLSTLPNVGTFSLTDPQPTPAPSLDLVGTNNYPNVTSVVGAGATKLYVVVGYVDPRFFPAPQAGAAGRQVKTGDIVTLDISHATPFNGVDPSRAFTSSRNPGIGPGPTPTATPAIGLVNGSSGPDLQTQSTVTFSISASPTPSGTPGGTPIPGIPKVIVSASRTQLREGADSTITFSTNLAIPVDLVVSYSVGGSATLNVDYTLSQTPGQVTIPANQTSASVVLHSITDNVREPNGEPAKLTILPGTNYQLPATKEAGRAVVLILDRNG